MRSIQLLITHGGELVNQIFHLPLLLLWKLKKEVLEMCHHQSE